MLSALLGPAPAPSIRVFTLPRKMSCHVLFINATTRWGQEQARVIPSVARSALVHGGEGVNRRFRRESASTSCDRTRCDTVDGNSPMVCELRKLCVTRVLSEGRHSANGPASRDVFETTCTDGCDLQVEDTNALHECGQKRGSSQKERSRANEGFVVKAKPHTNGCGCDVCMKLRSLIKAAKPDNNTAVSKSAIFVCFDGGFVIGKQQQKHHVSGCRCPNCNHLRFQRDTGQVDCITVPAKVLHAMIGKEQCYQNVFSEGTEALRRAKIGAANKGKPAWNKGKKHTPETIAKIRANTAIAMQNPQVKQRMRAAAAKTFHSDATKIKIRRTVRDKAHQKMQARNEAKARALGIRKGKVGICTIGMHARRISSVQRVNFGTWTKHAWENRSKRRHHFSGPARTDENNLAQEVKPRFVEKRKEPRSNRGVPKSAQHKAAISAALKAKWNDPKYVASQKKANSVRTKNVDKATTERNSTQSMAVRSKDRNDTVTSKRYALLKEMKEIYMKAVLAVRTLQEQKAAGVDVDEAMLKKALSAVAQTRQVLASVSLDDSVDFISSGHKPLRAKHEDVRQQVSSREAECKTSSKIS